MSGRDREALEVLESIRERGETQFAFVCLLVEAQTRLGLISEAVMTLQAALKQFPTAAKPWRMMGELQLQQGNYALAESSLSKSIELDDQNEPAQFALCQSLALQKKSEEATAARRRLDELRTQNRAIQTSFEQVHQQTFRRFACSTFRSMAMLHQVHREPEKAKRAFDRAIQVDPTDLKTLLQMANDHRKLGDYENAADVSRKIVMLQPEELSHYTNLANLCMEAGNAPFAEATLQLAANRNVGGGLSHLLLARFLMLRNKATEAVPPARRAVELLETVDSYLVLIDALDASGKKDMAEAMRTQARKMSPNDTRLKGHQK
jgi:tetratricopeptide (TPR) repeat protein